MTTAKIRFEHVRKEFLVRGLDGRPAQRFTALEDITLDVRPGEFLALVGAFEAGQTSRASTWVVFFATTGIILSAAYMLWLYRRVIFEKVTREDVRQMVDLHWR